MTLSQSSKIPRDPLSDVLDVLGARVTRRTRIAAAGRWALAFPAIDRLKFVALLRGSHWMLVPGLPPQRLSEGDVCLIGRTAYTVASDLDMTPIDGQALYDGPGCDAARIGGDDTIGIGGTVTFAAADADFLLDMLPAFMIVPRSSPGSCAIAAVLALIGNEIERDMMGGEIVSARLADVLVVEAIRACAGSAGQSDMGWLGALSDARLGRALRAIHQDVAQPWTVARLAGVAGMSRAAFSAEFTRRVGRPPLAYVRTWRLTIARAALMRGGTTIAQVASEVGYTSQSAFTHAFRQAFGSPPKTSTRP
ncbi:AraC family transcriptional regulator [Tistrella bauzanensis]|uniref:AraC family transcriptional regulator n=1 Tax=Tistrella bauzanensis TaxID=657419 RepID=A0ABQ1JB00_9PROT|nr:AraC family transcriptional regulator [Tistrella bauzanensis]GGB64148.1 AraC family transcriptional regulator [Tistrella bauzanensis]